MKIRGNKGKIESSLVGVESGKNERVFGASKWSEFAGGRASAIQDLSTFLLCQGENARWQWNVIGSSLWLWKSHNATQKWDLRQNWKLHIRAETVVCKKIIFFLQLTILFSHYIKLEILSRSMLFRVLRAVTVNDIWCVVVVVKVVCDQGLGKNNGVFII